MNYNASVVAITSSKIQDAFDYFNENFWQQSDEFLKQKFAVIKADKMRFTIVAEDGIAELRVKTWAEIPKDVKDALVRSDDPFWKNFCEVVGGFIGIPIIELPCIPP